MLLRVLKKDMRRKKGINFILFLFIIVSTVFLASSVNNMLAVNNATDYFLDKAEIPDEYIGGRHVEGSTQLEDWLDKNDELVDTYDYRESLIVGNKNVSFSTDADKNKELETNSTIYLEANSSDYVKVFDTEGGNVHIQEGEIGVLSSEADKQGIEVGDQIVIDAGDDTYEYTVSVLLKDALYGGDMVNMIRFIFNEDDYNELREGSNIVKADNYYVMTGDTDAFEEKFAQQTFDGNPNLVSRNTVTLIYAMDMIMAGMLTAIGVCLILIAVLVLRFTIVFTIQEEYREIGIMKAIGVRNFGIKELYLIKYFAIVLIGATLGCLISFPVGNFMLKSVSSTMLMEDSASNGIYNIACAIGVVIIVMLLCYLSMRKLNKMSVMDAIRSGQNGERYRKKSLLRLGKSKKASVPVFLALNDIISNLRQYIVLLLVFAVGIVLVIVPINTINTMKSSEMSDQFLLDKEAAVFLDGVQTDQGMPICTTNELKEELDQIREEFKEKGYDATISASTLTFLSFKTDENQTSTPLLTIQTVDSDGSYMSYSDGKAPILENEIAMSGKALKEMKLEIGDSVKASIDGEDKTFIITGTYQDYVQLGNSARLNPTIDMGDNYIYDYWNIPIYMNTEQSDTELIEQLENDFPDYKFRTAQNIVNSNVGGIIDSIDSMRIWLVVLMAAINIFITILMMKMFMMREKGQIAMLRSVGFKNRAIRQWQTFRIVGILVIADLLAIPLSRLMDATVLKGIFGIMGADITVYVVPLESYVLYPLIMLASIIIAAAYASSGVRKIDIREISNLE